MVAFWDSLALAASELKCKCKCKCNAIIRKSLWSYLEEKAYVGASAPYCLINM